MSSARLPEPYIHKKAVKIINYIILNGVKSCTINGLVISTLPPISKPELRVQVDEIDGRDGDIVTPLGYCAYDKTFEIGLYGDYSINDVIAYFSGSGTVTFSNEEDKYYNYQIIDAIDFEALVKYKTATVTMHVQPFKYSLLDKTQNFEITPNLLNIPDNTMLSGGVRVTVSNGVVNIRGTAAAREEFYINIDSVELAAGDYTLYANASGGGASYCSLRLIYNTPTPSNSFGETQITLVNHSERTIFAHNTVTKTYNYIFLSVEPGAMIDISVYLKLENEKTREVAVHNRGNIYARPEITVRGGGVVNVNLNQSRLFSIDFGSDTIITIDSLNMEAKSGDVLKNRQVTGDYDKFRLNVGRNIFFLEGRVSEFSISNYSRWL